jgi:molybdopterin converting factor small subunit/tRNA threonylcarbamoyladenosine modification (KEOPS) complex Cgi121 subunit
MITVRFLGGTKKLFLRDKLTLKENSMSVFHLLDYLQKTVPKNSLHLDVKNILVVVNGIDSSALQGQNTNLKDGDIVTIIPLIHGGSMNRKRFTIINTNAELMLLKKTAGDPVRFLEILREKYPDLVIQGIRVDYILSLEHAKKVLTVSLAAKRACVLLSNKMETDILMRLACTRQISIAIVKAGLRKGMDSFLIVVGKRSSADKLFREIKHLLRSNWTFENNSKFIQKEFAITGKELGCIISTTPLEDLLTERSAILLH